MFNHTRKALAALLIAALALAPTPASSADTPQITDEPGKRATVHNAAGQPVLTYEYAHDTGDDGKVIYDTAKVFYHVVAPDGKETLTKGPRGKLPHHRGIFIGWNKLQHDGKRHDLWHVRNTHQKHLSFTQKKATDAATTLASRIQWVGTHGKPVLEETRTVTVHHDKGDAYALIDVQTQLTAAHGDVELAGDPEHAGIQYRASQKVAKNNSATYTFPIDDAKAKKYKDLPWAAQITEIDGRKWTVQQMSHPTNRDKNARWSAYRDYGRFGEFPSFKLADGQTATLRYRFRITPGNAPTREALNQAYADFAD